MDFLKNKTEFETWQKDRYYEVVDRPKQFPCYVYLYVSDWSNQQETATYLYKSDIEDMLDKMGKSSSR